MAAAEVVSKPGARKSHMWEHFGFEGDEKEKPVNEDCAIRKNAHKWWLQSVEIHPNFSCTFEMCNPRSTEE